MRVRNFAAKIGHDLLYEKFPSRRNLPVKKTDFTLKSVRRLTGDGNAAGDVYELVLSGDASDISAPGQFVHIALPGRFLRRPVSVCCWSAEGITLLVKEAGAGTADLVRMGPGTRLDLLTGLGNGFDLTGLDTGRTVPGRIILAGGGIGIAPLYGLAAALRERGIISMAALGFRSAADAFYLDEFAALGCTVSAATEDGSLGVRGFVTDLLTAAPERDYVFCCGPSPMLRAVHALPHLTGGQFSFEARMACGFGACMGCSLPTADGMKRICKDGPVFTREEILWQET